MKRRNVLAGLSASVLAGCSKIGATKPMQKLFGAADGWHREMQRTLGGPEALAREFSPADISPFFRGNGTLDPGTASYAAHEASGFADWQLGVTGLVARPLALSLAQVRALPQRTQITRHDCVEGWSAIGQWTGPQLKTILDLAGLRPEARYIVFRCADNLGDGDYYESIDLVDAYHPQTIVAHQLNGAPLPIKNGAPLRMRIERQLGYKHAKFVTGIDAVASLQGIAGGKGGYWEDRGYQWYAGI